MLILKFLCTFIFYEIETSRPSTAEKENVANEFSKLEKAVTVMLLIFV